MYKKVGRPKGRKLFPVSISLTQEEINFLNNKPNASDLIRQLLDSLIGARSALSPEYVQALQLKGDLDELEHKLLDLNLEKAKLRDNNIKHFKGHSGTDEYYENYYLDDDKNPEPIDDEGRIAKRLMDVVAGEIMRVQAEINRVKAELLK